MLIREIGNVEIEEFSLLAQHGKMSANVYPHRFRHTYACQLLDNGAPLEFIQGMLGHEKASTTQIDAQLRGERRNPWFRQIWFTFSSQMLLLYRLTDINSIIIITNIRISNYSNNINKISFLWTRLLRSGESAVFIHFIWSDLFTVQAMRSFLRQARMG
ncbi:tyrosine-type recombinase/integrase [Paenibacillus sp. WQ 127069]|uniref:Tyrosine-type recombinase/integrase n=1 Tax=Paenibacillus baimaensis TaxID=2982185 RepID=A0ABT2UHZ9_9BACL|nr:tyrosine-type recombinase/integrase [Paenibacillus sp. WQ 127069]MCU6793284.1 tyrosine-type recombinase/integrase [Paenibacillus sp. WQ 127069]